MMKSPKRRTQKKAKSKLQIATKQSYVLKKSRRMCPFFRDRGAILFELMYALSLLPTSLMEHTINNK